MSKNMTEQEFKDRYKVVGEWIVASSLHELEYKSDIFKDDTVLENEGFKNNYWAIVEVEEGCYVDTIEDDFDNADEAWARWHELLKEKTGEK